MGELIQGWEPLDEFDVFTPNCPKCLLPMEPADGGWRCREEHLAQ